MKPINKYLQYFSYSFIIRLCIKTINPLYARKKIEISIIFCANCIQNGYLQQNSKHT